MSPDDIVTVAQIAEILKLNRQTVRNWIDAGALPATHIGRSVRVRWGDVEAMMKPAGPELARADKAAPSAAATAFWAGEYEQIAALSVGE
jgi:excisionase family DNA binding protein